MQLRGIATALYGNQKKSKVSITTLNSESADQIFIETTQKREIDPFDAAQARDAFMPAMDEMCRHPAQIFDFPDKRVQFPIAVVYGTPENHPAVVYRSMIRSAFPEYFTNGTDRNAPVAELLKHLFLAYYAEHCQKDALIELNDYYLFLPQGRSPESQAIAEREIGFNTMIDELHGVAESGNAAASFLLEHYAREAARDYAKGLQERGISLPRFVQYGLQNGSDVTTARCATFDRYNLRDIFVDELVKYMPTPHNVCMKTPNDKPSPPFSDICATYLADYWDLLEGRQQKKHVFARSRLEPEIAAAIKGG